MTDGDRGVDRQGIYIDRAVADAEAIPEDLDAGVVGPYRFPDPRRRRIAGYLYLGLAVVVALGAPSLPGLWVAAAGALILAGWHLLAAHPLRIDQEQALETAAGKVPFAVGHASAAITFVGMRSRPHWHLVLYSADEPPTSRALVELDAVTGIQVGETYVEAVPAD